MKFILPARPPSLPWPIMPMGLGSRLISLTSDAPWANFSAPAKRSSLTCGPMETFATCMATPERETRESSLTLVFALFQCFAFAAGAAIMAIARTNCIVFLVIVIAFLLVSVLFRNFVQLSIGLVAYRNAGL